MTLEQKELLLKDICARLLYGVNVATSYGKGLLTSIRINDSVEKIGVNVDPVLIRMFSANDVKPYLFPLSSMTDEQKEFIKNKFCYDWDIDDHPYSLWTHCIDIGDIDELIDWFHKNHIDYRGLIPMGLAIDATGLNIY